MEQAQTNRQNAEEALETVKQQHAAAAESLRSIYAQYEQEPENQMLRGAVQQAIKDASGAAKVVYEYSQSLSNAEEALQRAQNDLSVARDHAMRKIREQAQEEVAQAKAQMAQGELSFALNDVGQLTWEGQVDRALSGRITRSATLNLGAEAPAFELFGIEANPIGLAIRDLKKIVRAPKGSQSGHNIPAATVKEFPEALKNPVAVFENADRNSLYVLTSLKDTKGNPIVLIVAPGQADPSGVPMHRVVTAYGITRSIGDYLTAQLSEGSRYYVENEEMLNQLLAGGPLSAAAIATQAGGQLPAANTLQLNEHFNRIMPENSESVNTQFSKPENEQQTTTGSGESRGIQYARIQPGQQTQESSSTAPNGKTIRSGQEIMQTLSEALGIPIDTRKKTYLRKARKTTRGYTMVGYQTVHAQDAQAIDVAAHEIGHKLDDLFQLESRADISHMAYPIRYICTRRRAHGAA